MSYRPGLLDRIFGRTERKREQLAAAVERAKAADHAAFESARGEYLRHFTDWSENRELAAKVLAGDPAALKVAIDSAAPFDELTQLGSSVFYTILPGAPLQLSIRVNSEDVVPKETRTLLQSGKLSVKRMPQGQFYELYQDYVCGSVLRVAREAFALLPIDTVIVTAVGEVLNYGTGHVEELPIVSAVIPRQTLNRLNFEMLDASDSLRNFIHRMDFKKTRGFTPVSRIELSDLGATD